MIKNITLFVCLLVGFQLTAQDNKAFPMRFAFRHSDTMRLTQPAAGVNNTNAFVYNPTVNELWMSSHHNDTMMRFTIPGGKYLGAFRVANLVAPATLTTRYFRQIIVGKDGFIFGVNNTDTIRRLDPTTGQEVSRIVVPKWMGNQSVITYDSTNGGRYWIGAGSPGLIRQVDTTFQIRTDSMTIDSKVGGAIQIAYDAVSVGGPYMWAFGGRHPEFTNQTSGSPALTTAMQMSMATRARTGVQKSITDDFDFILNGNQSPKGFQIVRLPGFTKPLMLMQTGKFSSGTSYLLPTDLSGVTAAYEFDNLARPDASIDSLSVTPNYSIIPTPWFRPLSISAKMRNVVAFQATSGNVSIKTTSPTGVTINTQSVPFNTNATSAAFFAAPNTVTGLTKGINSIVATALVTNDPVFKNDTMSAFVQLSDSTLARDYGDFLPNVYVKFSQSAKSLYLQRSALIPERPEIGQAYKLDVPVTLTTITVRMAPTKTGDTTRVKVYRLDANRKPQYLGQSNLYQISPADSSNYSMTLPLTAPVNIAANQEFMVSVTEGFDVPGVIGTVQGHEPGSTFVHSLIAFGGWARADTMNSNTFTRDNFARALAIRPNFRLRTGVNEAANVAHLALSPNPTTGFVNLNLELDKTDDVLVRVFNLNGQSVVNQRFSSVAKVNQNLDLSQQANGIYVVSLTTSKGTVTRKVVKE
jgi:Secretion system C-terminal sorting domain